MPRSSIIDQVARVLCSRDPGHPLRVGIDGVCGVGKSTFAAELADRIPVHGRPAILLDSDGFHNVRAVRYRQGRESARGYYEDAYDFESLRDLVLAPLGPGGSRTYALRVHDLATDAVSRESATAPANAVVIFAATFLQRDGLRDWWDEVVYLDSSIERAQHRGVARDADLLGGLGNAQRAYASRYMAACRIYLAEQDPRSTASIVLDHDDPLRPSLTERNASGAHWDGALPMLDDDPRSPMADLRFDRAHDRLLIRSGDAVLAEYVFRHSHPTYESPRPYVSPIRTLGGETVSLYRPHDHVWHKGIAWSLPVVGDENFWGGPTFVRGEGYVQLPNNGEQRHVSFETTDVAAPPPGTARTVERLEWVTQAGETIFDEERTVAASVIDDDAWLLGFGTRMTNRTDRAIPIGSPTTRGRENTGYGGLFWRGPRSFTGGKVLAPGVAGGDELRGTRARWMGFTGRHDATDAASTVVMVDDPANLRHPPQWFARTEEFACLCPAPFFSKEHVVESGATMQLRYGVVIADGAADPERAARLAEAAQARLDDLLGPR